MPLDAIRQQHIQQMEQLKLLRNSGGMTLKKEDGHSFLKKNFMDTKLRIKDGLSDIPFMFTKKIYSHYKT